MEFWQQCAGNRQRRLGVSLPCWWLQVRQVWLLQAERLRHPTPPDTLNGKAKLTIKAAPYGSDGTSLKVTYNGVEVATLTMKNEEWTEYSIDITGTGTGKITFTPAKRMFLDEVRIVADGVGTGIDTVETTGKPVDNRVYNIQGQYLGTSLDNLPAGIYIVGGKKVVK